MGLKSKCSQSTNFSDFGGILKKRSAVKLQVTKYYYLRRSVEQLNEETFQPVKSRFNRKNQISSKQTSETHVKIERQPKYKGKSIYFFLAAWAWIGVFLHKNIFYSNSCTWSGKEKR